MNKDVSPIQKLGRWRILTSSIAAVYVYKERGVSTVNATIILDTGYEIIEEEADMEEAKAVVEAWGRLHGVE